jgi:hypothetical protein
MRILVESLLCSQEILLRHPLNSQLRQTTLQTLQDRVPASVLAHFLRLVAQERKGVAVVRHGVCSECHLRVPVGVVAALRKPKDLHLCENCGSYLLLDAAELAAVESPAVSHVPVARKVGRPRRAVAV